MMLDLPKTHWSDTEHYGLIGSPVRKSLSALMHNSNFQAMGMNAVYYPIDVDEAGLAKVMPAFPLMSYKGLNVTMPLKKAVIPYLDDLDEMGRLCGAVNTISFRGGRLTGTNTDGTGFVHALKEQGSYDPASRACVLFGSGGAGRGLSFALAAAGVGRLTLVDIPAASEMLRTLVSELNAYKAGIAAGITTDGPALAGKIGEAELVINATCVGMTPNENAAVFDTALLKPEQMVCDVVYSPYRTRMLDLAKQRGCRTLEGYWMLLWQGVDAFRFWTGKDPDVEVMKEAVVSSVTGRAA